MTLPEILEFKLRPALAECEQHRLRMHAAWEEALTFPPLQKGLAGELSEEQIRTLDQLLFRFGKLQDAIGTRLLPAILQSVQEWQENAPFLDKLNRAEKLGILTSVEQWQLLRELRNQTAHEYPDQPELVKANLARLLEQVPTLENIYCRMADWTAGHVPGASAKKTI